MTKIIKFEDLKFQEKAKYNINLFLPKHLKSTLNELIITELEDLNFKLLSCQDISGKQFIKYMINEFKSIKRRVSIDKELSFENLNSILGLTALRIEQISFYISFLEEKDSALEQELLKNTQEIFDLAKDKLNEIRESYK